MKRQQSTLYERICIATLPDSVGDEDFERLPKEGRGYLGSLWPGLVEENLPLWTVRVNQPKTNQRPEIQEAVFTQSYDFWSSAASNGEDAREWRVRIERERIILNYRKHSKDDPGSIAEFLAFVIPVLSFLRRTLGIQKWKALTLSYYFLYDEESLHATEFFRSAKKNVSGRFYEVKKFLVPFANFPEMDGFKMFITPYRWQQRWLQEISGKEYVSGIFIDTGVLAGTNQTQISMQLDVIEREAVENACSMEAMYGIIQGNYSRLICPGAWAELGGDCR